MRVYFDLPDDPAKAAGPYPLDFLDAVGCLFVCVRPENGQLKMIYTVRRDSIADADPLLTHKLLRVMDALEALAGIAAESFNAQNAEKQP
jgi:hypothetical protein